MSFSSSSGSSMGDVTFHTHPYHDLDDEDEAEVAFHSYQDPCFSPESADTSEGKPPSIYSFVILINTYSG